MKQRFYMLLAVLVLSFVGAFAQSRTPLKGDVNEDGVVDVADIVAIINIMKHGSQATYKYLLVNEIPSSAPTNWSTSTETNTIGNLEGWDDWKNKDYQYIVFPVQSGKTAIEDYFELKDHLAQGSLLSEFVIEPNTPSGLFIVRWNGFNYISDGDYQADITFK